MQTIDPAIQALINRDGPRVPWTFKHIMKLLDANDPLRIEWKNAWGWVNREANPNRGRPNNDRVRMAEEKLASVRDRILCKLGFLTE